MPRLQRIYIGLAVFALAACGTNDDGAMDTGTDAADTATDTADTEGDGGVDTGEPDSSEPDAEPDAGEPDTGGSSWDDCSQSGFCVLREPGCCESCGEVTIDDFDAVSIDHETEHYDETCGEETPACPACEPPPRDPAYIAACEDGTCAAYNTRTAFHSECTTAAECTVIWSDCCQCGPFFMAIATEHVQAYRQAVCDPRADCADCPAVEPSATFDCVGGHCVITDE